MPTRIRTKLAVDGERRNREQLARAGGEVREGRRRKHLTQRQVGARVGLAQATISRVERGHGGGLTMDAWQRIGLAIDRPLVVTFQRETTGETADAGTSPSRSWRCAWAGPQGMRARSSFRRARPSPGDRRTSACATIYAGA